MNLNVCYRRNFLIRQHGGILVVVRKLAESQCRPLTIDPKVRALIDFLSAAYKDRPGTSGEEDDGLDGDP
jgi:hypothetical protein